MGLEGPYALYSRGNIATMGGLSSVLGLALIPGSWIQSIQLTKGPGSVVNGPSAMSGQINYELRPSFTKQIGHFNLFAGPGRFEENLIYTWKQGKKWSSNLMLHGRQQLFRWDANQDGYLDAPLSKHLFVQNAWKYSGKNSEAQFGIKASGIENIGGSTLYGYATFAPIWNHTLNTQRYEVWGKRGFFLAGGINRSIGTQFSAAAQDLQSTFGQRIFNANERKLYGNVIFQDHIVDTRHTIKAGADINSQVVRQDIWGENALYSGNILGSYAEYNFTASPDGEGLGFILGDRLDFMALGPSVESRFYHVPRVHVKYKHEEWGLRAQLGRSYRIATLGAEYMGYMANNRNFVFDFNPANAPVEAAKNVGAGMTWTGDVQYKELQWYADAFYTEFENKVLFDFDLSTDTALVHFSSLPQKAASSLALQTGAQYELLHRTLFKIAYRYQRVQQLDLSGSNETFEESILNVPHLVYFGTSYGGRNGLDWELNATYNSSQRLPSAGYADRSPAFTMLNSQISYNHDAWGQFYLGVQNLLNVRQADPVIGGELPFDGRFDASIVWGPIMGRQVYLGWRYDLLKQES
jgi:hypothetical protein